jgi:zinc/manganese transport system substrate-binding protein
MFYASAHVSLIDPQTATLNPFAGDIHPGGNPHLHADPERLLQVSQALAATMGRLWPEQSAAIRSRQAAFEARWRERISQWQMRTKGLRGHGVAAQHSTFAYLWRWLSLKQTLDLEPKPGLPPTPGHLQSLLARWKAEPPVAVVVAQHQDARAGRWLTEKAQPPRKLLVLPATVTDPAAPQALDRWFDRLVSELLSAQGQTTTDR